MESIHNLETMTMTQNSVDLHDLPGWIVMGIIADGTIPRAHITPVLSNSSSAALALAAEANPEFQPIGILSENELKSHLLLIQEHRQRVTARN